MFFKQLPQFETAFDQTVSNIHATIDFNKELFAKSIDFFNELTDKKFVSVSSQVAESINKATDYAKENIKTSTGNFRTLLGIAK